MNDLPTMTVVAAAKAHIRSFNAPRGCKLCGCHERYLRTWNTSDVACVGCESISKLSLAQINVAEKRHNQKVRKAVYRNFSIPRVFGGMSTSPR